MIRAVLFDLDGTLLDIDLEGFLRDYFAALGPAIAGLALDHSPADVIAAVISGTEAMSSSHPGTTNADAFNDHFLESTGVDLLEPSASAAIDDFYANVFPALRKHYKPHDGALQAIQTARANGCKVALATNPIFPRAAIEERARWAGLELSLFDLVTSYEVMHATKPRSDYFREIAEYLEVGPAECLMVGDDPLLDLPAAEIGMSTWYVGRRADVSADRRGPLTDLARLIPALTEN